MISILAAKNEIEVKRKHSSEADDYSSGHTSITSSATTAYEASETTTTTKTTTSAHTHDNSNNLRSSLRRSSGVGASITSHSEKQHSQQQPQQPPHKELLLIADQVLKNQVRSTLQNVSVQHEQWNDALSVHCDRALARWDARNHTGALISMKKVKRLERRLEAAVRSLDSLYDLEQRLVTHIQHAQRVLGVSKRTGGRLDDDDDSYEDATRVWLQLSGCTQECTIQIPKIASSLQDMYSSQQEATPSTIFSDDDLLRELQAHARRSSG